MEILRIHGLAIFLIISITILFICPGCGTMNRTTLFTKPIIAPELVTYRPWNPNRTVCVLPFENLSKDTDADIKVREVFVTELFIAQVFKDIIDVVEANAALMRLRIRKPNSLDKETIRALGEMLGADYLILGLVTEYGYGKGKESGSEVGLSVRMIDVDTGNILWTANNFKMGTNSLSRVLGISQGPSPMELTREVVGEIVAALKYEISHQQRLIERNREGGGGIFGMFGGSEKPSETIEYRR